MINELVEKSAILPKRCRDIAEGFTEISDMTTTAGVTVIDTVLSGLDPDWFQKFKKEEKGVTPESNRIVNETRDEKVPSPYNMDFQAVMKMFNFRKEKVEPINEAYSLGITPSKYDSPFLLTVNNLIDVRNDIVGHLDAIQIKHKNNAKFDSEEEQRLIFKYREGVLECVTFLSYFKDVKDEDGQSFYEKARAVRRRLEKIYNVVQYPIDVAIKNERLRINVARFMEICNDVYINTSSESGKAYFYTDDYNHAIQVIRVVANLKKTPEQRKNNLLLILFVALAVAVAIIVMMLKPKDTNNITPQPPSQSQGTTSKEDTSSTTSSAPQNSSSQGSSTVSTESSSSSKPVVPKISGETTINDGLTLSINQSLSKTFKIAYKNESGKAYSLGWVQSAGVVIETTENTYYCNVQGSGNTNKIAVGGKGQFTVVVDEDIEGQIQSITIENILPLTEVGLPEHSNTVGTIAEIPITYK